MRICKKNSIIKGVLSDRYSYSINIVHFSSYEIPNLSFFNLKLFILVSLLIIKKDRVSMFNGKNAVKL